MQCIESLPSKKLLPILTSRESYPYLSTSTEDYLEETKSSTFISNGRLTSTCIFTQFDGPDINSLQLSTLSPGNEAIFAKLHDYTYYIKYDLRGEIAKLWTINLSRLLLFEMYDVNGKVIELCRGRGELEVYSFNFPLVVELPMGANLTLEITIGRHLTSTNDPLSPSSHCLLCSGRPHIKTPLYENVTVIEDNYVYLSRVVNPNLQDINAVVRGRYFRNYRLPCVGRNDPLRAAPIGTVQTFVISPQTATDFLLLINDQPLCRSTCPFNCRVYFTGEPRTIFDLSQVLSVPYGVAALYFYAYDNLNVQFAFDVTMTYNRADVTELVVCDKGEVGSNRSLSIFDYTDEDSIVLTTGGDRAVVEGIRTEPTDPVTTIRYKSTLTVPLRSRHYYYFLGQLIADIDQFNTNSTVTPSLITGTIVCTVVA